MKLAIANSIRAAYIKEIMAYLESLGEDVALVASNTCNLPCVDAASGEEGVLEITVKVVKKPYDECMQEREDYIHKCVERAEKQAEREKAAAEKKAKAAAKKKETAE